MSSSVPLHDPIRLPMSEAGQAVRGIAERTPLISCPPLDLVPAAVCLKLETRQVTGSFKVRGAAAKLSTLGPDARLRGVVACSSGNHGRAVAFVASRLQVPATICVPEWTDASKQEAIEAYGADLVVQGESYDDAEEVALGIAAERGTIFISPFDDLWVIAGQGTIGTEILEELPEVSALVVPLSGGGLISGIAYAAKRANPNILVIAASAERARVMYESQRAGRPLTLPDEPTLADALSGGIGMENHITFRMVRDLVDHHVLVTEDEIADAIRFSDHELGERLEGGGAVALAALRVGKVTELPLPGGPIAAVLSGANIAEERWQAVLSG